MLTTSFKLPKKVELFWLDIIPTIITFVLFIFCLIPKYLWGLAMVMPLLPLMPIFYWGRSRAPEMGFFLTFIIGLLSDALSSFPIGGSSILYMLILGILHKYSKQLNNQGFAITWGYFTLLCIGFSSSQFLIMSFYSNTTHAILPALIQLIFTISLYPIFHKWFDAISEKCQTRRWILSTIN